MHVTHLITDAGPHPYFRTLVEHTDPDRVRLSIGCVGPSGPLQDEMRGLGVDTFAMGTRRREKYPLAAARLARSLRARDVDIVHAHLPDGCLVGLTAARLARRAAVMTAHHSHELPFHGAALRWLDTICGMLSDRVIAPSRAVAVTITEQAHVRPGKVVVIHHGFDLDELDAAADGGREIRAELGLSGALVLGAIGRHYWLKGYESLVTAFATIAPLVPEARLLIVARDGDSSGVLRRAEALGVRDKVILTGARRDIPQVLASLDVFVHSALAESFGMVIIEALAAGVPVVSTPVGIAPEVVLTGRTGVLAESTDARALTAALHEMLLLRSEWATFSREARRVAQNFPAATMTSAYEQCYREVLDLPAGSPGGVSGSPKY